MLKKMSQLGTPITRDAMKNITGALAAFPEWTCYYNGSSVQMCLHLILQLPVVTIIAT